jgi:hypothetical protein
MCDTTVQDTQIVRITEQIATLNADKAPLAAIHNPNAEIINLINNLDGQIARLYVRLSNVNTTKAQLIATYNAQCTCRDSVNQYGQNVVGIYNKYNPNP